MFEFFDDFARIVPRDEPLDEIEQISRAEVDEALGVNPTSPGRRAVCKSRQLAASISVRPALESAQVAEALRVGPGQKS
jgi:hypothetical protein